MDLNANVFIDIVGLLIVIIICASGWNRLAASVGGRLFRSMLVIITLILLCDIPAWTLDGMKFTGSRHICFALDTLYYSLQPLFCFFWLLFTDYRNFGSEKRLRKLTPFYAVPMLAEIAVIAANIWTGWIFTINGDNVYARGDYYVINLIPYYLYIAGSFAICAWVLFTSRDEMRRRRNRLFMVFMTLPLAGTLMATWTYGVSCDWPLTALSLLMIFLDVQNGMMYEQQLRAAREAENAAKLKAELAQSRVAIMLSQIQPHFLYNVLGSIKALCRVDPLKAEQTTSDFTTFLRGNISSLSDTRLIPFERELEHTKYYLKLEKVRFADRLNVRYDIQTSDFRLPTLTLQPLVENAVRHGVCKREDGGTVTITAAETPDGFAVTVTDDGPGFDVGAVKGDGRAHIGIENVRNRVSALRGGTLTVKSAVGVGTTATITLPKEEERCS